MIVETCYVAECSSENNLGFGAAYIQVCVSFVQSQKLEVETIDVKVVDIIY